eukprot:7451552-Pyramimonas_sp.AAC.1
MDENRRFSVKIEGTCVSISTGVQPTQSLHQQRPLPPERGKRKYLFKITKMQQIINQRKRAR